MVKIIMVQPVDNALGADGLVPGFQTDYTHSVERDNSTESTKMGSISAIGTLTETMELSMYGRKGDAGQKAIYQAIKDGKELKVWEIETEKNDEGTHDAKFAYAVVDSFETSSPPEGLDELSASMTVQIESTEGAFMDLPPGLINFAKYGFQKPGDTTGDSKNIVNSTKVTGITVTPDTLTLTPTDKQQLSVEVTPANASNQYVTYTTSNASVATVSPNGLVTAVAAGTTTITVKSKDNPTITTTVTVEVN
ncbi:MULTISPECIES: phage major tail protein, TP901-1 family [Lysinibacillus]|uniref:Phage major tail protein, TP901-1 family n=1 Tax=Lysinibacillus capsici TaxID=2115968 RepID=A0ABY8KK59_9BACI|nr:phage major tail protein, TP901-1 family [Lysinibacillus capsici]WGF39883.1 phage major tail protein, TP901-1 family [Lysinibacillus capsici]